MTKGRVAALDRIEGNAAEMCEDMALLLIG
jgi:hypothetical protein